MLWQAVVAALVGGFGTASRKSLAQYDQIGFEQGTPARLNVSALVTGLEETSANTMNFLLWDTDGHQYLDLVLFLEATTTLKLEVWVTLIPPTETVPGVAPTRPRPGCTVCPTSHPHPYGDGVHGVFCCSTANIVGGSCNAPASVCCIEPGSKYGCQGVGRCGTNPSDLPVCGPVSQCSVPADSPLTPFNETALVNHTLGFRGCNDYVGWGKILSRLAAVYPALRAANIDDFSISPQIFTESYAGAIRNALHGGGDESRHGGSARTRAGGPLFLSAATAVVKFIPTFYYSHMEIGDTAFVLVRYPWLSNVTDGCLFYFQNRKGGQQICADSPLCGADTPTSCHGPNGTANKNAYWACLWDSCAEASVPHGLSDEVSDFAAAMPAGHELHVGLYFSGYGAAPCRAVPSVKYGHDALAAALALTTAVDGVMVYTFETPGGPCPNATDRGCAVKEVFSAHGTSPPSGAQ